MTPKQFQSQVQTAVFVGVIGANVVLGFVVTLLAMLFRS